MKVKIQGKKGLKVVDLNSRTACHEKRVNCSAWSPSEVRNYPFIDISYTAFVYVRVLRIQRKEIRQSENIARMYEWSGWEK